MVEILLLLLSCLLLLLKAANGARPSRCKGYSYKGKYICHNFIYKRTRKNREYIERKKVIHIIVARCPQVDHGPPKRRVGPPSHLRGFEYCLLFSFHRLFSFFSRCCNSFLKKVFIFSDTYTPSLIVTYTTSFVLVQGCYSSMREPNFSFPAQNRAAVVISSTLYDRRALDCTATLPLVNSLTHLAYMTSTSPRIREILAADGGLERLVKILATCQQTDRHSMWKWSLAFQSVVNVGVRGTEAIRSRVVETGTVHVVLAILENFLRALEHTRAASNMVTEDDPERTKQQQQQQQQHGSNSTTTTSAWSLPAVPTQSRSMPITPSRRFFGSVDQPHPFIQQQQQQQVSSQRPFAVPKRRTFLTRSPKPKPKPIDPSLSTIPLLSSLSAEAVLNREEDVLLSLQLLAYLSKYPHIRQSFHNDHRKNVFSVVEKFTHRIHPHPIMYWAGVIMRNACRKDEARGGIRQCAYMHCGKWERYPREFAKCRRW